MRAGNDLAVRPARLEKAGAERWQAIAARNCPNEQAAMAQRPADQLEREWQIIDGIQSADGKTEVIAIFAEIMPILFNLGTAGQPGKELSWINHVHDAREITETGRPCGRGATQQQCPVKGSRHVLQPIEAVIEHAIINHHLCAETGGAIATQGSQVSVE